MRRAIIASFTETENSKRKDRPELLKALEHCKRTRSVLVIAKLDRLARKVAFIANLMEPGVEFLAVDFPDLVEAAKEPAHWRAGINGPKSVVARQSSAR